MNEVSAAIATWLARKRRTERASAAVFAMLALSGGVVVFLLIALLVYLFQTLVAGGFMQPDPWLGLIALGISAAIFALSMKSAQGDRDLKLDPLGYWIIKDIFSIGPRLVFEGFRQIRCCALLGELNVAACAQALAYLARQNAAVDWTELVEHSPLLPGSRLKEQLCLVDGVLFLGHDATRVTLMEPFRLRLRWMLPPEPAQPKPVPPSRTARANEPAPKVVPVNEPETLSPYEILGLSPSASAAEIKSAYRKRVKECHPDLFAGMDQQAQILAERWTKALNAAYATLSPRPAAAKPKWSRHR